MTNETKIEKAIRVLSEVEGISLEMCGEWLWIDGNTKPHKEELKALGARWAHKKQKWYIYPEGTKFFHRRKEQDMDAIRKGYGSEIIKDEEKK